MTRYLLIVLIMLGICSSAFAQADFLIQTWDFVADYIFTSNKMFYFNERFGEITEVKYEGEKTDKDGYQYVKIDGKYRLYIEKAPVEIDPEKTLAEMTMPFHSFLNFNVKSIKASSALTETIGKNTYEYKPSNMMSIYFQDAEQVLWKKGAAPWVEGKEDTGIGETIEIEFDEKTSGFMILNGFVNPSKKELYKYNNRVKMIRVISMDPETKFSQECEIPDFVHFYVIKFPSEIKKIQIEILEVYRGEKYNDTCITAIVGRDYSSGIEMRIKEIKAELLRRGLIK